MNNKRRSPRQDSIFQTKGFYIALYSCVAVLLIAAIAITYSSLNEANSVNKKLAKNAEQIQSAQTSVSPTAKAKEVVEEPPINVEIADANDVVKSTPQPNESGTVAKTSETPETKKSFVSEVDGTAGGSATTNEEVATVSSQLDKPVEIQSIEILPEPVGEDTQRGVVEGTKESAEVPDVQYSDSIADPVFNTFDGEQDMSWPLVGEIVMNYSVDTVIYDKTLEQYRTNDTICISASSGASVKASSDGVVVKIENSRENGNTVVIEHGNGWSTTYGQLNDKVLVSIGDVVTSGQEIGTVAPPSIYSVLLGNHLSFKVAKDNNTINPNMVLVQN